MKKFFESFSKGEYKTIANTYCLFVICQLADNMALFFTNVGLSMISYTGIQKNKESSFRREPVKRTHGKIVIFAKMNGKLHFEVIK